MKIPQLPTFTTSIPHSLPVREAIDRIRNLIAGMNRCFVSKGVNCEDEWNGSVAAFRLDADGLQFSGTLKVKEGEIEIVSETSAGTPAVAKYSFDWLDAFLREHASAVLS